MRLQFVEQLRACYFIPVGAPNSLTGLRFVNPKRVARVERTAKQCSLQAIARFGKDCAFRYCGLLRRSHVSLADRYCDLLRLSHVSFARFVFDARLRQQHRVRPYAMFTPLFN